MKPKHRVHLSEAPCQELHPRIPAGHGSAREPAHARIILKANEGPGGPGWRDEETARALDVSTATIERVRRRFVADGLAAAVRRKPPAREYRRALDGEAEAHLVALSCSEPPTGKAKWSMRLLAERLVELRVVEAGSDGTVGRGVEKKGPNQGERGGGGEPRTARGGPAC